MSRREFLRASAVVAAGALSAACVGPSVAPTEEEAPAETEEPEEQAEAPASEGKYKEAPMLAEAVAAGDLPSVDQRLPENPMILEPYSEVGNYGGSIVQLSPDPTGVDAGFGATSGGGGTAVAARSYDLKSIVPWLAESWELSEDHTEITISLRKGVRWSDGALLTTEDVRYWYEDVLLNEELTPEINPKWKPGDEVMELLIEDDYTFRLKFAIPYPIIIDYLPSSAFWSPKHYLQQFHVTYNEEAEDLAADEGFGTWVELYQYHANIRPGAALQMDVELPTLAPWAFENEAANGDRTYVRNPYYWVVDADGNQLPYTDYLERWNAGNRETLHARTMAGEGTHASWYLSLAEYPVLKQNEEKGNYTAGLYPESRASEYGFCFNYTHKDPVLRELFNDVRWRQAMSHAINREEIKELRFMGKGMVRQPIADPGASFFEEGIDQYYVEYDIEKANALLDELGLEWDKNEDWRLRPDGEPLVLTIEFWSGKREMPEISELIKSYWEDVGVRLKLKPEDKSFYLERLQANEHDLACWAIGGGSEIYARQNEPIRWRPPWHWPHNALAGTGWRDWLESDGEEGMEPPEIIKELWETTEQWLAEPRGTEKYMELGKKILRINAENAWLIGTVGLVPRVGVIKNTVRNAPEPGRMLSIEYGMWGPYKTCQWWIVPE
jgi:peptide/nickel transport system substrate-binding protein